MLPGKNIDHRQGTDTLCNLSKLKPSDVTERFEFSQ